VSSLIHLAAERPRTPAFKQTSDGWLVRLGPFASADDARRALVLAAVPEPVARALNAGQSYLAAYQGHYTLRVDGGPKMSPVVVYGTGATFRERQNKKIA
jgi:hypothetical protein